MDDCIFCKIARGEIPASFVYENKYVVAFPDIHPEAPGHTLVIPREHYAWFYEVPGDVANKWFAAAQEIAPVIKSEHNADYVELRIEGVDVHHAHIHLIPRKKS